MFTLKGFSGAALLNNDGNASSFGEILGIAIYGRGCGGGYPTLYVRVSSIIEWIEGIAFIEETVIDLKTKNANLEAVVANSSTQMKNQKSIFEAMITELENKNVNLEAVVAYSVAELGNRTSYLESLVSTSETDAKLSKLDKDIVELNNDDSHLEANLTKLNEDLTNRIAILETIQSNFEIVSISFIIVIIIAIIIISVFILMRSQNNH